MVKLAIIGGSGANGVVKALGLEATVETVQVFNNGGTTSFSDSAIVLKEPSHHGFKTNVDYLHFYHGDTEVYFILRHGKDHTDLPARLDQRGILAFLKDREVDGIVLTSATGSLDTSIPLVDQGGIVVNSGTFRGFGYRGLSFNDPEHPHAVLAQPYDIELRELLLVSARGIPKLRAFDGGLYVQNEGNSFESPAEIADLYCRLDAPTARVRDIDLLLRLGKSSITAMEKSLLEEERDRYQRLGKQLTVKYAQVSMNAVRETILGLESGLRLALVSFPVNYGAGLVPEEQVDHKRTKTAIARATEPYLVPFLRTVIENAPNYLSPTA